VLRSALLVVFKAIAEDEEVDVLVVKVLDVVGSGIEMVMVSRYSTSYVEV
jgi:hypothetical protein